MRLAVIIIVSVFYGVALMWTTKTFNLKWLILFTLYVLYGYVTSWPITE